MYSGKLPTWIRSVVIHAALIALSLTVLPATVRPDHEGTLILAVHPYLPHGELIERFKPLAEYLSGEIGREVEVRIGTDYREHAINIGDGTVDIAYLGPALYVTVIERYGKHPLLATIETDGTPDFAGMIIVRDDSPVTEISGLRGKEIAFVDPNSTMGYLVPLHILIQDLDRDDILRHSRFLGSHINVALGVLTGDFEAGAVKEEVFFQYRERGLRELATTPKIPEHLFIARKDLPPEIISELRRAFSTLSDGDSGRQVMNRIKKDMTGMVPAEDSDFDTLREILRSLE